MPTFGYEDEYDNHTALQKRRCQETAGTAELEWVAHELAQARQHKGWPRTTQNDSTMSGSFLEESIAEMRRRQTSEGKNPKGNKTPMNNINNSRNGFSSQKKQSSQSRTQSQQRATPLTVRNPNEMNGQDHSETLDEIDFEGMMTAEATSPQEPTPQQQRQQLPQTPQIQERIKGPNEILYVEQYQYGVEKALVDHNARYPGQIRDYRQMSDEEKRQAQKQVANLLARLRIANHELISPRNSVHFEQEKLHHQVKTPPDLVQNRISLLGSPSFEQSAALFSPEANKNDVTLADVHDDKRGNSTGGGSVEKSAALFSPEGVGIMEPTTPARDGSQVLFSPPNDMNNNKTSPVADGPIENARSCQKGKFQSPEITGTHQRKKRMASISGKRGSDCSRFRLSQGNSPLTLLEKSMGRLSISPVPHFRASQSPILPDHGSPISQGDGRRSPHSDDDQSDISFGAGNNVSPLRADQSIQDSLVTYGTRVPIGHATHNVGLKNGSALYYKPLETEPCPQISNQQSFPDPLKRYPKSLRTCLKTVYKRTLSLQRREPRSSMVFSLAEDQIIDISLKMLLDHPEARLASALSQSDLTIGSTLIILRDKAWIEAFGRAFREGSSLSVLDHCSLPARERKSLSNTHRFSKYGVVLTTFDALKANDTTLSMDEDGALRLPAGSSQGNWHASRNGSQAAEATPSTAQCSILHRIHWTRVILVDILGRKSYLAKPDTSRYNASKTLSADSRLFFFHSEEDDHRDMARERLLKSDKKSLAAICTLLQLSEERWDEATLEELSVDADDI